MLTQILIELKHISMHVLQINSEINNLKNQNHKIMSKQDELNAAIQEIQDSTTAIAARIQAFIDAGADNVTEESLQSLQSEADALKAIGTPTA